MGKRGPQIGGAGRRKDAPVMCTLHEARTARGMTQRMLAEMLTTAPQTVALWESGKYWPHPRMMFALAYILGVTVPDLWPVLRREVILSELGLEPPAGAP